MKINRDMKINRSHLLRLAVAPALLLGGCMGTQNRGLESVHQPVVSRTDYALDLATGDKGLGAGEGQRLGGWLDAMRLGYGDRIAIDDSAGPVPAARAEIGAIVGRYGLLLADGSPVTQAPVTPGTVRVVVSRMHAGVPGCPDYSRDSNNEFDGNTSSNHGCAINSNLAAMIARPEDLVHGQSDGAGSDTAVSAKAIASFRKAVPTGEVKLERQATGAGK